MLKKEARKIYREKRMALTQQEQVRMDDLLLIQFQSVTLPFIHSLLSYWPIEENNEPNTHLFTEFLRFRNPELVIAYPVADFKDGSMVAVATDIDTAFTKQDLNIFEPTSGEAISPDQLDIVFVPLLAFDTTGIRVGYGKGFYDQYLRDCSDDCLLVGFSYFEPIDPLEDPRDFDVPLDLCITPQNVYVF